MAQPSRDGTSVRLLLCLLVIFVAIGVTALLLPVNSRLHDVAILLWGAVPVSVALWDFAYHRIERYRLFINRVRLWITNPESTWGLTAELDVVEDLAQAFQ